MTSGNQVLAADVNQLLDALNGNRSDNPLFFGSDLAGYGRALTLNRLAAATLPTLAVVGGAGTTTWSYQVVATTANGDTTPSPTATTTTGPATLNGTNYITITWTQVLGATNYKIIRTAAGGTPSGTGLIQTITAAQPNNGASAPTMSVNDTGLSSSGYTAATVRSGADLVLGGRLLVNGAGQTVPTALTNINANVSAIVVAGYDGAHKITFNVITATIVAGSRLFTVTLGTGFPTQLIPVGDGANTAGSAWQAELVPTAVNTYDVYNITALPVATAYVIAAITAGW